jgi:hypothetical protein
MHGGACQKLFPDDCRENPGTLGVRSPSSRSMPEARARSFRERGPPSIARWPSDQSWIAAKLQDNVARRWEEAGLYKEIAEEFPLVDAQRLLDASTASGLQLNAIHEMEPNLALLYLR